MDPVVEADAAEPVDEPVDEPVAELSDAEETEPDAAELVMAPRVTGFVVVAMVFGLSITKCGVKLTTVGLASSTISRA